VEEPSIVAGTSKAALLARKSGGFTSACDESLLAGQVHISDVGDTGAALEQLEAAKDELITQCNAVHPRLVERGGGVTGIEARSLGSSIGGGTIAVHILVDTCDAMGANLVNSICEAVAPSIQDICGGHVALRILSNLADRSIVTARVSFELGEDVRNGIELASDIACADPHRAATHNKGIMNGIDALAIATGNDWRAIEAGAHAYASRDGQYRPLATWTVGDSGELIGEINIPLKVGTVGGNLDANTGAAFGLATCGVASARELAELMAAVGLAQNFAALHALASTGIQAGHMKLHARSVASAAGIADEHFEDVVDELVAEGDIKVWRAQQLADRKRALAEPDSADGIAAGKVILLGEHAVVYGKHALALPIANAVSVTLNEDAVDHGVPELDAAITLIKQKLGVDDSPYSVHVSSRLPLAMGLGASAAFAVAITRAFNSRHTLGLDDAAINDIAFECEKLAHGTPSGIDNSVATYAEAMLFSNDGGLDLQQVSMPEPPPLLIACSHQAGRTKEQVAGVRARHDQSPAHYDGIFGQIDDLSLAGAEALASGDYDTLGNLMNICHGLLNAIEVSNAELEGMISIARATGAVGAKITGAGGGGSIVALCPGSIEAVSDTLELAGFKTMRLV